MNRIRGYAWAAAILAMAVLTSGAAQQNQNNLAPDKITAKCPKTCRSSGTCGPMTTPLRLDMNLKPLNEPTGELLEGRSFAYSVEIANTSSTTVWVDVWAEMKLPSGHIFGPILLKRDLRLPAESTAVQEIRQRLPKSSPPGAYTLNLQMGTYPDAVLARDEFTFEKRPGEIREVKSGGNGLEREGNISKPASPDRAF